MKIRFHRLNFWEFPFWQFVFGKKNTFNVKDVAFVLTYEDLEDLFNGDITELQYETYMGTCWIKSDPKHTFSFDERTPP